jgi:hypothetical protein
MLGFVEHKMWVLPVIFFLDLLHANTLKNGSKVKKCEYLKVSNFVIFEPIFKNFGVLRSSLDSEHFPLRIFQFGAL